MFETCVAMKFVDDDDDDDVIERSILWQSNVKCSAISSGQGKASATRNLKITFVAEKRGHTKEEEE